MFFINPPSHLTLGISEESRKLLSANPKILQLYNAYCSIIASQETERKLGLQNIQPATFGEASHDAPLPHPLYRTNPTTQPINMSHTSYKPHAPETIRQLSASRLQSTSLPDIPKPFHHCGCCCSTHSAHEGLSAQVLQTFNDLVSVNPIEAIQFLYTHIKNVLERHNAYTDSVTTKPHFMPFSIVDPPTRPPAAFNFDSSMGSAWAMDAPPTTATQMEWSEFEHVDQFSQCQTQMQPTSNHHMNRLHKISWPFTPTNLPFNTSAATIKNTIFNSTNEEASSVDRQSPGSESKFSLHSEGAASVYNESIDVRRSFGRQRSRSATFDDRRQSTTSTRLAFMSRQRRNRPCRLLHFISDLLANPSYNPSIICWVDREERIFKLTNATEVARMWGQHKQKPNMTYETMGRALRYYYAQNILKKVKNQRLVYQFFPSSSNAELGRRTPQ